MTDPRLDRLLERTFARRADQAASCPDAETLAAWIAGGLTAAQQRTVEAHAGDCARCQEMLATMARMPSTLPEPASRWSLARFLFWAAPIAAAAAALVVWLVVVPHEAVSSQRAASNRVATAPAAAAATAADADMRSRTGGAGTRIPEPAAAPERPPRLEAHQQPSPEPRTREQQPDRARTREEPQAMLSAKSAIEPPMPPTQPAPASPPGTSLDQLRESDAASTPAKRAAAAPPSAGAAGTVIVAGQTSAARAPYTTTTMRADVATQVPPFVITAPDSAARWRVIGGRRVESSNDGGTTWGAGLESTGQITAGASPGGSICWLVGRRGLVLLSVDGHSWHRVDFPEPVDLIGVRPVDAATATVNTADGRTFSTRDGGAAWTIPPPAPAR